jgi:hypothetical protein
MKRRGRLCPPEAVIFHTGGRRQIQVSALQIACKAKAAAAAQPPAKGRVFRLRRASTFPRCRSPDEPPVQDRRHTGEGGCQETLFNPLMLERQMFTAEPSYFNFLMEHRCVRRARVPFAKAVGLIPELTSVVRARWPQRSSEPVARMERSEIRGPGFNRH